MPAPKGTMRPVMQMDPNLLPREVFFVACLCGPLLPRRRQ